jgi:hypothetical protein
MIEPKIVSLTTIDGQAITATAETMPVARFRRAWGALRSGLDEITLLDLAFNQPEGWSLKLTPDSYTTAVEAMYAVNPDFFGSVARRQAFASTTG